MKRITLRSYILGYGLSLVLTLAAYFLVQIHLNSGHVSPAHSATFVIVTALAITQFIAQLVWFLHLGHESKPRWNLVVFVFMLLVLGIIVFGSLWIMNNLNYHMRSPQDLNSEIIRDEGMHR